MFHPPRLLMALIVLTLAHPLPARPKSTTAADSDYVSALAAANNFLYAWQSHDEEAGILLLTDPVREHTNEEAISTFFSSTHPQQAYEIARGHKLAPGRYQFPIALWQSQPTQPASQTASAHARLQPRATTIIVQRTPKNDWLIDKLP